VDLLPGSARRFFYVFPLSRGIRVVWVNEHADHSGVWGQLVQQFQSLCRQGSDVVVDARDVAAWPVKAGDEAELDRINGTRKYNRNRRGQASRKPETLPSPPPCGGR
jgi:hypothetical protein